MNKKPIYNALLASGYIALVATFIMYGPKIEHNAGVLAPISILSLLTLSVTVMGYLFAYEPIKMYLDGDKLGATKFFGKTLGSFAIITIVIITVASFI